MKTIFSSAASCKFEMHLSRGEADRRALPTKWLIVWIIVQIQLVFIRFYDVEKKAAILSD